MSRGNSFGRMRGSSLGDRNGSNRNNVANDGDAKTKFAFFRLIFVDIIYSLIPPSQKVNLHQRVVSSLFAKVLSILPEDFKTKTSDSNTLASDSKTSNSHTLASSLTIEIAKEGPEKMTQAFKSIKAKYPNQWGKKFAPLVCKIVHHLQLAKQNGPATSLFAVLETNEVSRFCIDQAAITFDLPSELVKAEKEKHHGGETDKKNREV